MTISLALRLTDDQRGHLYRLTGQAAPAAPEAAGHVDSGLAAALSAVAPAYPASIVDELGVILAQNRMSIHLLGAVTGGNLIGRRWAGSTWSARCCSARCRRNGCSCSGRRPARRPRGSWLVSLIRGWSPGHCRSFSLPRQAKEELMVKIAVIIGSTRPGRNGEAVARWVETLAKQRDDAEFELVDLLDFNLPHLDEPLPPSVGNYANDHTKAWSEKIKTFDGYVFVTPEYNHSTSGALKNAIDYLYAEWNNKAAGFVSYGAQGGARAVEHLRLVMGELQIADVRTQVTLYLYSDFENYTTFKPAPQHEGVLTTMLDQLVSWSTALQSTRNGNA